MLNLIWLAFFGIAAIASLYQWLWLGNQGIFTQLVQAMFDMSKTSVDIAIGLVGALSLWLGIFKIAEHNGWIEKIATWLSPLFHRLMPEVPANHPAIGSVTMNLSANVLGLDNAATPLGIKAMKDLQSLNPSPDTATNAQILFLVLNTSSVTLFPIFVFVYRAQQGAAIPTDVFLPILLTTSCSSIAGLLAVALVQRINLLHHTFLLYAALAFSILGGLLVYFLSLPATVLGEQSALIANLLIFSFIIGVLFSAYRQKLDAYTLFIEGAKEGFQSAIQLIPYLLAMLVAIAVLRASGSVDLLVSGIASLVRMLGFDPHFVEALPTAIMKPLSGSGARAMMVETMQTHGADSFAGRLASVFQGSTETTFYVLAVYFGAVGIKHSRHAIPCALVADVTSMVSGIVIATVFFG
ncbi:nucleoside recognition domain-containing protein [Alteromonas sp. a30]|uniref:nucleoside recognition domain-containing protein n=1 Tax=Alteromonas sp. a30 TaxID=2730917 RepID=UPI00227FD93B|nr:spore maturation protein [Alteromonas sp. a30]MCY7294661.1 spore maturation protein [Alteromonas sp. a30]